MVKLAPMRTHVGINKTMNDAMVPNDAIILNDALIHTTNDAILFYGKTKDATISKTRLRMLTEKSMGMAAPSPSDDSPKPNATHA